MSLIHEQAQRAPETDARETDSGGIDKQPKFQFLPKELIGRCRKFIENYHAMYGYVSLPDMLWLSDARDVIECHGHLTQIFKKASKLRGARRANNSFLLIATVVVALEVLTRDFAGWGKRFPAARRQAEKLLGELPPGKRVWLMDLYLYPPLGVRRELVSALAPSESGAHAVAWN